MLNFWIRIFREEKRGRGEGEKGSIKGKRMEGRIEL
jgi:hypothetical protein